MNEVSQRLKIFGGATGLIFFLGVLAVLFWIDPAQQALYPACPLHRLTGWNCPGCGGLRATHHLLHGRVITAFHYNPLWVGAAPLILIAVGRWLVREWQGRPAAGKFWRPWKFVTLIAVVLLFGILRNVPHPAFAWMSP